MRATKYTDRQLVSLSGRLNPRLMRPADDRFLCGSQRRAYLSPKQRAWLEDILERNAVILPPSSGAARAVNRAWLRIAPRSYLPLGLGMAAAAGVWIIGVDVPMLSDHVGIVSATMALLGGATSRRRWTSYDTQESHEEIPE